MGLADLLIKLGIGYGTRESLQLSNKIGFTMINQAMKTSALLARDFGAYPKYKKEAVTNTAFYERHATTETRQLVEEYGLRNSQLLTIAPTGSLSTMWGISGGIEPIFQISYTRNTKTLNGGQESFYKVFTPIAESYMTVKGLESESHLPKDLFVTTSDLNWRDRIKMQGVWQEYIDASISSTVNLPKDTTKEEVFELYMMAWKEGLKGVTIYRDGCKRAGILITDKTTTTKDPKEMSVPQLKELLDKKILESVLNNPNQCAMCGGEVKHANGCHECIDCGYSPCAL
jgi:ribonucleoside-diphosphate reductase alpha chain